MTAGNGPTEPGDSTNTVACVEEALGNNRTARAALDSVVAALQRQVAHLETSVRKQRDSSDKRAERLEAQLAVQEDRLERLGANRERSLLELRRLQQELRLVQAERDALRTELERVAAIQTETVAYDADTDAAVGRSLSRGGVLPSIDELMGNLPAAAEPMPVTGVGHATGRDTDAPDDGTWAEMIPADAMVRGGGTAPGAADQSTDQSMDQPVSQPEAGRWRLIRSDTEVPQEYSLNGQLMTLGRSEMADINIEGEFVSRVHARLLMLESELVIEDAGSKNGVIVNGDKTRRRPLHHGDEVVVGAVSFRVIDRSEL